jgi:hypothetical protein
VTTTAPQALMLLNDRFVQSQSEALAARAMSEAGVEIAPRVKRVFQLVLQRDPSEAELESVAGLLAEQQQFVSVKGAADADVQAFASFCRAMLNCNEMIYVD